MQDLKGEVFLRNLFEKLNNNETILPKLKIKINTRYLKYIHYRINNIGKLQLNYGSNVNTLTHNELLDLQFFLEQIGSLYIEPMDDDSKQIEIDFKIFQKTKSIEIKNCKSPVFHNLECIRNTLVILKIENTGCSLDSIFCQKDENGNIKRIEWPFLKELILPGNEIAQLDESLHHTPVLEKLDLTYNVISKIENLQHCYRLTTLILRKNCIWGLENIVRELGCIRHLDLGQNGLFSTKGLESLLGLEILNISNNHISELEDIYRLSKLPCLVELYVEGNPVTYLQNFRMNVLLKFANPSLKLDDHPPNKNELKEIEKRLKELGIDSKDYSTSTINKKGTIETEKKPPSEKWTTLEFNQTYNYPEEAKESKGFHKAVTVKSNGQYKKKSKVRTRRVVNIEDGSVINEENNNKTIKPKKKSQKNDNNDEQTLEKIKKLHDDNGASWLMVYNAYREDKGYDNNKRPDEDNTNLLDKYKRNTVASMRPISDDDGVKQSNVINIPQNSKNTDTGYDESSGSFDKSRRLKNRRTIMMSLPISSSNGSFTNSPIYIDSNIHSYEQPSINLNISGSSIIESQYSKSSSTIESPRSLSSIPEINSYENPQNLNIDKASFRSTDSLEVKEQNIDTNDISSSLERQEENVHSQLPSQNDPIEQNKISSVKVEEEEVIKDSNEVDIATTTPTTPTITTITTTTTITTITTTTTTKDEKVDTQRSDAVEDEEDEHDPTQIKLNKKTHLKINVLEGSDAEQLLAYLSVNFIVFNTNINKEQHGAVMLTSEYFHILSKRSPLKSYFYSSSVSNTEDDERFAKFEYEKISRIVVSPFYQWFRVELPNEAYVILTRCHLRTHMFIKVLRDIMKERHSFIQIGSANREIVENLEEIVSDTLPQSSGLTFYMMENEAMRIEMYAMVTQLSKLANKAFNVQLKKNNYFIIPRTLVVTNNDILILNEDFAKYPSSPQSFWQKPKTPQFTLVKRICVSDVVELQLTNPDITDKNYLGIVIDNETSMGSSFNSSSTNEGSLIQFIVGHEMEKEKLVSVLSRLYESLFRVELKCK